MSYARTEKRHPRTPVEKLLTTREDIIAFADFISKDENFCLQVWSTIEAVSARVRTAEAERIAKMPKWRRILHSAGFVK